MIKNKIEQLTKKQIKKYWNEYIQSDNYKKVFSLEKIVRLDGIQMFLFENWLNSKLDNQGE